MTNQQGAPEALLDPSPDQLRAIARTARNSSGSASDDCGSLAYVLHGWRAAVIAFRAKQAALVEAQQPAAHVQKPAEIEHVAGDVSKNGPGSNMAQQPAPSAAAALPEGWVPLVITHEGQYPEEVAYGPQILMDRLGKWLRKYFDHVVASKAKPSPTPQADSQPAPVVGRMSPSKEWLETRLAIADDSGVQAGVPPKNARPCDAPPGCNSHNCLECNDYPRAARSPADSVPSSFGSPELQAIILARCLEKDPADSVREDAARDVLAERQRQISAEGYDAAHDDEHVNDEIAAMAALFIMPQGAREWDTTSTGYGDTLAESMLPPDWEMPALGDRRRELVRGAAMALAELERIDRAARKQGGDL